jgi:hypothetical protein
MIYLQLLDERALVEGAKSLGYVFAVRTPKDVTIRTVRAYYFAYCR